MLLNHISYAQLKEYCLSLGSDVLQTDDLLASKKTELISTLFRIPEKSLKGIFLKSFDNDGLFERASWKLRFCPACIKLGYHSPLYQLLDIVSCPIHMIPLKTTCPECERIIPYSLSSIVLAHPYSCDCGHCLWQRQITNEDELIAMINKITNIRYFIEWLMQRSFIPLSDEWRLESAGCKKISLSTLTTHIPIPYFNHRCIKSSIVTKKKIYQFSDIIDTIQFNSYVAKGTRCDAFRWAYPLFNHCFEPEDTKPKEAKSISIAPSIVEEYVKNANAFANKLYLAIFGSHAQCNSVYYYSNNSISDVSRGVTLTCVWQLVYQAWRESMLQKYISAADTYEQFVMVNRETLNSYAYSYDLVENLEEQQHVQFANRLGILIQTFEMTELLLESIKKVVRIIKTEKNISESKQLFGLPNIPSQNVELLFLVGNSVVEPQLVVYYDFDLDSIIELINGRKECEDKSVQLIEY